MTSDARQTERKSQILKGLAEVALLALLRSRAMYGLEILDGLRSEAGLDVAEGTIYPLLHRLERAGFVKAEWRLDNDGGRPRKYYALTKAGMVEQGELVREWQKISSSLSSFLNRKMK
ncbi:MAG: helix-turn-helix transcriptional regulator [Alphaproteobacteria bacterium]|nr:helix-turn-helix transcriptional regulator [Alphaproteobacteria bacterium]